MQAPTTNLKRSGFARSLFTVGHGLFPRQVCQTFPTAPLCELSLKPTKSKAGELKAVTFLEEWLIASALHKNQELVNEKNTHFLKNLHVVGIFNAEVGEAHAGSKEFKRAIFWSFDKYSI
jgi:hypothetical protein